MDRGGCESPVLLRRINFKGEVGLCARLTFVRDYLRLPSVAFFSSLSV